MARRRAGRAGSCCFRYASTRCARASELPACSVLDEVAAGLAAREVARRDGLLARVEIDRVGAVRVEVAEEAVLPAREREEGNRGRHADVHADHPGLDVVLEAP